MHIGELPNLRQPNATEVEEAVEKLFPSLQVHEQAALVKRFLESEKAAAEKADE